MISGQASLELPQPPVRVEVVAHSHSESIGRMAAPCELCERDDGLYYMSRACCRARYIVHVPLVRLRRGWLARWKAQLVTRPEFYAEIEAAVAVRWEKVKGTPLRG